MAAVLEQALTTIYAVLSSSIKKNNRNNYRSVILT
jgi:hypothetical protein